MKEYPLSLHSDYRSHWSVADAIREILQNALDDKSSFEYGFPSNSMIIRNVGVSLDPSTLLLGNTSKAGDSEAVGGFGEGYKIALLILCREGYKVTVRNGNRLWTPIFKMSELYNTNMLHIIEEPLEDNEDLTFIIEGISEELKYEVISKCLYLQKDLGDVIETSMGRILKDISGKLYVGGLFVTNTDLRYSYDFNPEYLELNTDRQSVSDWDLKLATSEMLGKIDDVKLVTKLVLDKNQDVRQMEYRGSRQLKTECFNTYIETYGKVPIAEDNTEKVQMEKDGWKNVSITDNYVFTKLVKSSPEYKELSATEFEFKEEEDEVSPLEMLENFYNDFSKHMDVDMDSMLETIIDEFQKRGVIWDD